MPDAAAVVVDEVCAGTACHGVPAGHEWLSKSCPAAIKTTGSHPEVSCSMHYGTRPAVTWHRFSCCTLSEASTVWGSHAASNGAIVKNLLHHCLHNKMRLRTP